MNKKSDIPFDLKALKAEVKAKQPKTTPWWANALVWLLDSLSAAAILALAIIGALTLIQSDITWEVKIGISALVVGLMAARLIERIFKR